MYTSVGATPRKLWNRDGAGENYCHLELDYRLEDPYGTLQYLRYLNNNNKYPLRRRRACAENGRIGEAELRAYHPKELEILAVLQSNGVHTSESPLLPNGATWMSPGGAHEKRAAEAYAKPDPALIRPRAVKGWGIGADEEAPTTDKPKEEEKKLKPVHMALIGAGVLGVGFLLMRKK